MKHFCRQASRLASDAFERPLSFGEQARLQMHLLLCAACRNHRHNVTLIHDALALLRRRTEQNGEVQLPEGVRAAIRKRLREAAQEPDDSL